MEETINIEHIKYNNNKQLSLNVCFNITNTFFTIGLLSLCFQLKTNPKLNDIFHFFVQCHDARKEWIAFISK
jgi:hypothetical protein